MMKFKEIYKMLHDIDVTPFCKKKQSLTYLPWANAYNLIAQSVDSFDYEVVNYTFDGIEQPYYHDADLGYMVHTRMTIEGHTREERLPVLDFQNRSMRSKPHTYKVKSGERTIEQASSMDINTAIKRCFVKNCALFGLGIDLYIGEDVQTVLLDVDVAIAIIDSLETMDELQKYWKENQKDFSKNAEIISYFAKKKKELK